MENLIQEEKYTLKLSIKLLSEDTSDLTIDATISEKTFTADNSSMDIEIKFDIPKNKEYIGNVIVASYGLYNNNNLISEYTDMYILDYQN